MPLCTNIAAVRVQGDILKKQKMRFGLVLGRLAILKKKAVACKVYSFCYSFYVFVGKKRLDLFLNVGPIKVNLELSFSFPGFLNYFFIGWRLC